MVIEGIEEVSRQLKLRVLSDVEGLSKAHIPVVNARLAQPVAARVAIHAESGLREAAEVDALQALGEVLVNIAAGGLICTLKESSQDSANIGCRDAVWETGLEGCDTGSLPSTDHEIGSAADAGCNLLSTADRHVVDIAGDEPVVYIEVRQSVIELGIVIVHKALKSGAGCANAGSSRFVVLTLGPGVDSGGRQAMCTVLKFDVYAVVV